MRGINSNNDGQQIYSYDADFKKVDNDDIRQLFTYQHPALGAQVMTEELAKTMPRAFLYRNIKDKFCAIALNTYLGRDYMGSAGRFGNQLSHVIVFQPEDTKSYPIEYYNSSILRSCMMYDEVNNPNQPDFLPQPELQKGSFITVEHVLDFLNTGDNLNIFKNMLSAMLSYKKSKKRLVICDTSDNIALWIGALEYVFPLRNSLNINFSTYEFDPSLSRSQICGVVQEGTKYSSDSWNTHFVFDFFQQHLPVFDISSEFFEFIDNAISFSFDSLLVFHKFLIDGYTYDGVDEDIFSAYQLYSFLSDGMLSCNDNKINAAISFARKYATEAEKIRIVQCILSCKSELLKLPQNSFTCIFDYLNSVLGNDSGDLKKIIKERIISDFLYIQEDCSFLTTYENVLNIPEYINYFAEKLFIPEVQNELSNQKIYWKFSLIITILGEYIKLNRPDVDLLLVNACIGSVYFKILESIYSDYYDCIRLSDAILDSVIFEKKYFFNMSLNLEGILLEWYPNNSQFISDFWLHVFTLTYTKNILFKEIIVFYSDYERFELIFEAYKIGLELTDSKEECQGLFETINEFANINEAFRDGFHQKIITLYFNKLKYLANNYDQLISIFNIISSTNLELIFTRELISLIISQLPFSYLALSQQKDVQHIYEFCYESCRSSISPKLCLLVIGVVLINVKEQNAFESKVKKLKTVLDSTSITSSSLPINEAENYFNWILGSICRNSRTIQIPDLMDILRLFRMEKDYEDYFLASVVECYLNDSGFDFDERVFQLLNGLFSIDNVNLKTVGHLLGKKKVNIKKIDRMFLDSSQNDLPIINKWNLVKSYMKHSSLDKIYKIFKGTKKEDNR